MNINKPILGADGRPFYCLGGMQAWRTHDAGDYIVSLEWVENEPAMVIWSKRGAAFAFVICLSSIGKYATPEGDPNPEGANELARALPDFGRAIERTELHHLVSIILRYTPELILMPPMPREVWEADNRDDPFLEVTTKDERGKVIAEVEI
jgi:hypothetical protein